MSWNGQVFRYCEHVHHFLGLPYNWAATSILQASPCVHANHLQPQSSMYSGENTSENDSIAQALLQAVTFTHYSGADPGGPRGICPPPKTSQKIGLINRPKITVPPRLPLLDPPLLFYLCIQCRSSSVISRPCVSIECIGRKKPKWCIRIISRKIIICRL